MLAFLLFTLAALAAPLAPALPTLTDAEQAALRARKVVVRSEIEGQLATATGLVQSTAPPDRMWAAVLDFQARIPENDSLQSIEEYARASVTDWSLRFRMSIFGFSATFHNRYVWDRPRGVVTYTLDEARENDLARCDGWYLTAARDGGSLFVYHSASQSDAWAPGWVLKWLANDSMVHLLTKIRERAER